MSEQEIPQHSSLWFWTKYYFKKCCHRCTRFILFVFNGWFFSIIFPWVTGSVYAVIDFFEDETWFKAHRPIVGKVFVGCLVASLLTQFVQGLRNVRPKLESDKTAREIMSEFIQTVGVIVNAKLARFRAKLPMVKQGSDKFRHITLPQEQLKIIGEYAADFLRKSYGLKHDEIDITILRRKDGGDWHFTYQLQSWTHGATKWISERNSAAQRCCDNREEVFFPDKIKSASEGHFVLSARDKRRKTGSAYIYPMSFQTESLKVDFVVSIVTYGKQFAPEYDETSCEITKAFLREICRRYELELCLDTIKSI